MTRFELKTLNPLVEDATAKINKALALDDVTARTDALLAAREENATAFKKTARRQIWKMVGLGALAVVGILSGVGGAVAATSLVATLAGTTGAAMPLMAAGVSLFGGAAAFLGLSAGDNKGLVAAANNLNDNVDREISKLVTAYPQETAKSSKLAAFLKATFNPAASNDVTAPAVQPQPAAAVNSAPRVTP